MRAAGKGNPRLHNRPGFSIGEAASLVGVSTHVLRSWERRLSLDLNHRTASNQRRYRIEDIRRLMDIRQLHEKAGLPLVESAARALATKRGAPSSSPTQAIVALDEFWAALIETFPEIVLVLDESGRITATNEVARSKLKVREGSRFSHLAPVGWGRTYAAIHSARRRSHPTLLAMRARTGTIYIEATVAPVGRRPDGPIVLIGRQIREGNTDGYPGARPEATSRA